MSFRPTDANLFFSRHDSQDPRLGDLAKALPLSHDSKEFAAELKSRFSLESGHASSSRHFVLAGYPDDEGIRLNGGRTGASFAPDTIRKPLYKMTPSSLSNSDFQLWDVGNLQVDRMELAKRHEVCQSYARQTLDLGATWISLGGGHDYGYPDAAAFIEWSLSRNQRPLVLNFDAHLDVRPVKDGLLSSGTPFFRMLETYADKIDFLEIGLQSQCNSKMHLDWLRAKGARLLMQEEVESGPESFANLVMKKLDDWALRARPVFLSIDIDGFSSSVAPGCSQSWATGFMPREFFQCLEILKSRFDIRALGIYEVSPPLDQDDRTSKLAAQIIHRVLSAESK